VTSPIGPFYPCLQGVRIVLRVTPNASRSKVEGLVADAEGNWVLKVLVTVVPEDGKANEAVIKLLSKAWKLPKSSFSVIAGQSSRSKTLLIEGDAQAMLPALLQWIESNGFTPR
jgi:uncharacterized protein